MLHIKFIVVVDFLQIRRSVLFLSNIIKSWIYLFLVKGKMSFAKFFGEFFHQELVLPVFKHFPDEHFLRLALPRWKLLRWSLPRRAITRRPFTTRQITDGITPWSTLPIDIFLTRKNLDKQFSVQIRPELAIPRPNKCLTDVFPTRCILERIFPRPVKYLKQPIADNSVDKTFMN